MNKITGSQIGLWHCESIIKIEQCLPNPHSVSVACVLKYFVVWGKWCVYTQIVLSWLRGRTHSDYKCNNEEEDHSWENIKDQFQGVPLPENSRSQIKCYNIHIFHYCNLKINYSNHKRNKTNNIIGYVYTCIPVIHSGIFSPALYVLSMVIILITVFNVQISLHTPNATSQLAHQQ